MPTRERDFWEKASELLQHADRIHRSFIQAVNGLEGQPGQTAPWAQPVNLLETESALWIISAMPGVALHRTEVRLEGGELIISGYRPVPESCGEGEWKVLEIPFGRLERRVRLPAGVSFCVGEIRGDQGLLFIQVRKV